MATLRQAIERALADAAEARAAAEQEDREPDPWELLSLDPDVSARAWARYIGGPGSSVR